MKPDIYQLLQTVCIMSHDQLASLVNSVDPDQLASEVAILFSMQDVSS